MRTRLWFLRIAARRNRIAAHGISRNLRRFSRWMIKGTEAAPSPHSSGPLANPRANTIGGGNVVIPFRTGRLRRPAAYAE